MELEALQLKVTLFTPLTSIHNWKILVSLLALSGMYVGGRDHLSAGYL